MPATFRIYSSSAGSGKTYQLTKEYLKLALGTDDPTYFKSILAITFTNDAAGEMKERIIGALRRFARVPAEGDKPDVLLVEVAQELATEGHLPPFVHTQEQRVSEVRRRATATFRLVLYHYADFAVSTIDSFVQRIVLAFTRELGLPASFEVELDTDSVLQSAVAALLDKVNRDPNSALLSQMLADYALGQAEEGRSWSKLPEELVGFGRALFNETVQESVAQLGKLSLADFRRLDKAMRTRRGEIETVFEQAGEAGAALLADAGVSEADLYQGKSGIWGYVRKGKALLEPDAGPNSYVRTTLENDKWYSGKIKSDADKARVDAVKPALTDLAATLGILREKYLSGYVLMTAMQPYLFHASLLSELNKLVEEISRERNVVLISEFNRRIASIVLTEPVPFLYERLGDRYNHLLIDEFQDTSVLQWNNLLPLVENTLANNQLSLAVGDAKQSIYRWRGGEMEQILRLYQENTDALANRGRDAEVRELLRGRYESLRGRIEPKALNINYRSAREIIDFNNTFFTQISQRHTGMELVTGIFDTGFVQEAPPGTAKQDRAGHVQVLFTQADAPAQPFSPTLGQYLPEPLPGYPAEALLDYNESTCYLALQLVEQALVDGYGLADVTVLCRTRWQSRLVAKFLKERGFPIISADSLALEFAEVVNLLVAVLRVLHQPANTLARAEALLLFDKVVRRVAPTPARVRALALIANDAHSEPFYEEFKAQGYDLHPEETGNLGLYELAERLMQTFELLGRNGEGDYLFRFLDLTLEYSLRFGNNLGNFLAYWDQRKSSLSINAPGGRPAITITTVHKAKGLAYGVVIVPFADWTLEPRGGTLLWGHLDDADKPLPGLPDVAVASLSSALQRTALGPQYDEEREKTFLEGLNTLYVALTRPRHRLYIISKMPDGRRKADKPGADSTEPAGPARNVAELLHGYLQAAGRWNYDEQSYIIAQGAAGATGAETAPAKADTYALTNLTSAPWEDRLELRRHANTVFDFDQQEQLGEWNRKLHYGLRRLHQATDVGRVAGQLVAEGLINNRERAELEEKLREVVEHPRLAHFFSAQVGVETEREILVGGVRLRDYKPDRVVFEADAAASAGGRAGTRVTLLDFKIPPPQEQHRRRLRQYGALFQKLGYAEVQGLIYYFGTGEVIDM